MANKQEALGIAVAAIDGQHTQRRALSTIEQMEPELAGREAQIASRSCAQRRFCHGHLRIRLP
jgi:hypothetical protein